MDERAREGSTRIPLRGAKRLIQNMLEVEQPLIGAVNGDAVGLGATIALFCDIVIAASFCSGCCGQYGSPTRA